MSDLRTPLREGLRITIAYFDKLLAELDSRREPLPAAFPAVAAAR